MPADAPMMRDEIANAATDKNFHEWGQSVAGFERLVKTFSQPGDVVCDPFLGGGTTAVAALANSRRFTGCDIDKEAIATSTARLEGQRG
jgi:DNA modification methylase